VPHVETVQWKGQNLAILIHAHPLPDRTTFLTPDEATLQVGYVVYPQGSEIPRHIHNPVPRAFVGTAECLLVQKGSCEVDIFDQDRVLVTTRRLACGDILLTLSGGHGFRVLENLVLLEVKLGPYVGPSEKGRF
jgi:hypothetical protein